MNIFLSLKKSFDIRSFKYIRRYDKKFNIYRKKYNGYGKFDELMTNNAYIKIIQNVSLLRDSIIGSIYSAEDLFYQAAKQHDYRLMKYLNAKLEYGDRHFDDIENLSDVIILKRRRNNMQWIKKQFLSECCENKILYLLKFGYYKKYLYHDDDIFNNSLNSGWYGMTKYIFNKKKNDTCYRLTLFKK